MSTTPPTPAETVPTSRAEALRWWARECIAFLTWTYITVKLLLLDIDLLLLEWLAPAYRDILHFKAFGLLSVLAVGWVVARRRFPMAVAYIVVYPLTLIFWRLPKLALPYWPFLIALAPAMYRTAVNFRATFVLYSFGIVSGLAILRSREAWILGGAMSVLLFVLGVHLWRSIRHAYAPGLFEGLCSLTRAATQAAGGGKFDEYIATGAKRTTHTGPSAVMPAPAGNQQQGKPDPTLLYALRSAADLVAIHVGRIVKRKVFDLYLIASLLNTYILTALVFALEYTAVATLDSTAFRHTGKATFWLFLQRSVSVLTPGPSTVEAISLLALALLYLEVACAVLVPGVLVFTLFRSARERFSEGMEQFATEMRQLAEVLDGRISVAYSLTLEECERVLLNDKEKGEIVTFLRRLRGLPPLLP
jgi:hypothetical protein